MAKITFGLGTSHSPMISLPVEIWPAYAETASESYKIQELCVPPTGEVMTYEELLERADPAIGKSLTPEKFQAQWEACQGGVDALSQALREAAPDVAVMVTDDQNELFFDDNYPMFSVYYGDTIKLLPRKVSENASATAKASTWGYGDVEMDVPVASDLALHCIESLRDQDFDISASRYLNEEYGGSIGPMGYLRQHVTKRRPFGIGHGFGFIIKRIMHNAPIPIVPISQNTCYPPNQPTPRRSYLFGQALRKAIESWGSDKRVAVMASGGLSHSVVDEEQDRGILKALAERDADYLCSLPRHRMNAGTSESQNWITCAGAMEHLTFKTEEYVAAYRTPAGTGGGWAFGVWS